MGDLVGVPLFFPDVEQLIVSFLGARSELAGIPVGITVPDGYDGKQRAVVVTRVGGAFLDDDLLDDTVARVDAYGPDKGAAHTVARTVRGLLPLLTQTRHADGVVVSEVSEVQGPYWFSDKQHAYANRYLMRYRLIVPVRPKGA
jgi:hypothetical protein